MKLEDGEKEKIIKWAKNEEVPAQMVYDALLTMRDFIGSGYVLDIYWGRGACDLVRWYRRGLMDGQKMFQDPVFIVEDQVTQDITLAELYQRVLTTEKELNGSNERIYLTKGKFNDLTLEKIKAHSAYSYVFGEKP